MPSLQERFNQFDVERIVTPSDFATWAYNLLGALVEAVEPEDTDATIRKLRARLERERDQTIVAVKRLREQRDKAEKELAEAKAAVAQWRDSCRWWKAHCCEIEKTHTAEAVEPEDTPTDEQYNDARDDRIRFLQKELAKAKAKIGRLQEMLGAYADCPSYDDARQLVYNLRKELAKAKAERDSWERQCRNAEHGLAEAKEEIERLRKVSDDVDENSAWVDKELAHARAKIQVLREQRDLERAAVMMGKPVGPRVEAQFEKLKADAEIGRLVRGMRSEARLEKHGKYYNGIVTSPIHTTHAIGPLEALRAIQEKGDGL